LIFIAKNEQKITTGFQAECLIFQFRKKKSQHLQLAFYFTLMKGSWLTLYRTRLSQVSTQLYK